MSESNLALPRDLGDGLILRWATSADADELAEFNIRIHTDDPAEPELFLGDWTHDLMRGDHPTTSASDFTVVVDESAAGKIVSSMNLISQTWAYDGPSDGVEFDVGRPELVGTDEAYRRRGLVRAQFEAIHAKSAARGELVQAITGIPWYYRQFEYEMCVDLGGSRNYVLLPSRLKQEPKEESYRIRPAEPADVPVLRELYAQHCAGSLLSRPRTETMWQFELFQAHRDSPYARAVSVITAVPDETVLAYVEVASWRTTIAVREIAVAPGHSLRAVALFVLRHLAQQAVEGNQTAVKPKEYITFPLGTAHPLYQALDGELEKLQPPYGWYMRVPDLAAFLAHVTPVLEARLLNSVMAGHSGKLRLNFYRHTLELGWEHGRLTHIAPYQPKDFFDGDAFFPELTFLQLLFGHRSIEQLRQNFVDCTVENLDTAVLLNVLFPRRPSWVVPLG